MTTVQDTIASIKGIPTKVELLEMLHTNLVTVVFTKMSGDERTMTCTLVTNFLPQATTEDTISQTKIRNLEENVIVVWETKTQGWRSFRYDRIIRAEIFQF